MNQQSNSSRKAPPSFTSFFAAPPLLKPEPVHWKRRQRSLQAAALYLNATVGELAHVLGTLPTPQKYDRRANSPNVTLGPPRKFPPTAVSAWLRGVDKMPLPRLAAAVAVLEFLLVKYDLDVAAQEEPDASVVKRLDLAREHVESLTADASIDTWLTIYRDVIGKRLELDRKKSTYDENLFLAYHDAIEERLAGAPLIGQ